MPPDVLDRCDVLENEFVSIGLEKDLPDNDPQYLDYLEIADRAVRGTGDAYATLKQRHRQALQEGSGIAEAEAKRLDRLMQILRNRSRTALCLSGGGIRSATFGLGVLQGMAHQRLLHQFDYLSTVSGGGYIGSWLSSWMAGRRDSSDPTSPRERATPITSIETELAAAPREKFDGELPQVGFLRSYSNYLSPQVGLLSADSWTLAATVVRNMFLNWMILIPMLSLALLVPYLALVLTKLMPTGNRVNAAVPSIFWALLALGFLSAVYAVLKIGSNLPSIIGKGGCSQTQYIESILIPLTLSAILLSGSWIGFYRLGREFSLLSFSIFGAALHLLGWWGISDSGVATIKSFRAPETKAADTITTPDAKEASRTTSGELPAAVAKPHPTEKGPGMRTFVTDWATGFALVTGAAGGAAAWTVTDFLDPVGHPERTTWLTLPMILAIYFLATALFIGLASKKTNDEDREWWARSGAWIMIVMGAWLVFGGIVIYGPALLGKITSPVVGAGGLLTGWLGSRVGASSKTGAGRDSAQTPAAAQGGANGTGPAKSAIPSWALQYAGKLAPLAFFLCLLLVLSKAADLIVKNVASRMRQVPRVPVELGDLLAVVSLIIVLFLVATIMSRYVNVNTFSLHAMYRNRLIRAYLGASRQKRDPNPFTGFDPDDNLKMHQLSTGKPFHVLNIALNLVHGKRLAWQERKAETFTVTRLHSGSVRVGYQPSATYGDKEGITLGTAMAVSGAAASPNMGYHSSALLTFLMTFFNARLGWWLANPGQYGKGLWSERGPKSALRSLVGEAFGLTDDESPYVYLSDGGHFENLGLYEMVLRRCNTIVVLDAGADPQYEFEDLANAIRKIRVDLGVAIQMDKPILMTVDGAAANVHCATGTISYSCIDGQGVDGTLVYVKPVLDQWQSVDIDHYHAVHPDFPQQTTADQFFDESQFESYRRLGMETIERICQDKARKPITLGEFVTQATTHSGKKAQAFRAAC